MFVLTKNTVKIAAIRPTACLPHADQPASGVCAPVERPVQGEAAARVRHLPRDRYDDQELHEGRHLLREDLGPEAQGVLLLRWRRVCQ